MKFPQNLMLVVLIWNQRIFKKLQKKNRLPFVAVRVVIDDLKLEIPQFITKATKANGETNYLLILLGIIKKPTSLINIFRLGLHYYLGLRKLKVLGKLIFNNFKR